MVRMPPRTNHFQISAASEFPSSLTRGQNITTLTWLKEKLSAFWLHMVRGWPTMLSVVCELLQLVFRANLMFFYFEGLYYHISKCAVGIRYVFIGKASNQRPRYQILGVFLLIQLCIIAIEGLRQSNLSSIASSVHQASFVTHQRSAGTLASSATDKGNWVSDSSPSESQATSGVTLPE